MSFAAPRPLAGNFFVFGEMILRQRLSMVELQPENRVKLNS
jgi:hypothetical protein